MNSYVNSDSRRQFVLDQLATYAGLTKKLKDSTFIVCPVHAEKTPSGRIFHGPTSKAPGYFVCYGCGYKANWNELAPKIGLKPFTRQKPSDEFARIQTLASNDTAGEGFIMEKMQLTDLPKGKLWRGISTDLLIDIGAKRCKIDHPEYGLLKTKLYLPCLINGELKGYIKARLTKHADYPSYINAKGSWSKTHGLFPFDHAMKLARKLRSRTMVLVEGQRDALRLIQNGIPAMCILGTQSWSSVKARLLELGGIKRLILMMDGDDAGIAATEMLQAANETMFAIHGLR